MALSTTERCGNVIVIPQHGTTCTLDLLQLLDSTSLLRARALASPRNSRTASGCIPHMQHQPPAPHSTPDQGSLITMSKYEDEKQAPLNEEREFDVSRDHTPMFHPPYSAGVLSYSVAHETRCQNLKPLPVGTAPSLTTTFACRLPTH